MNEWERWGKRFCKAALWAPVYVFGAMAFGLTPSWKLLLFVIACHLWDVVLDAAIPTDASQPSSKER